MGLRIGFVSTRLAGTDGVSLEAEKWAAILQGMGHECFYFAGESTRPAERTMLVPLAHFTHPEILSLSALLFDTATRTEEVSRRVQILKDKLKADLTEFVRRFGLDLW
ncbi:MAG: glycosyltransferase family 1 protein, partial [Anaerolineales bacterium]